MVSNSTLVLFNRKQSFNNQTTVCAISYNPKNILGLPCRADLSENLSNRRELRFLQWR